MPIKISRGGETANRWTNDAYKIRFIYLKSIHENANLQFKLPSKGGGVTDVLVEFPPDTFEAVIDAMLRADREAAISAFRRSVMAPVQTGDTKPATRPWSLRGLPKRG